MESTPDTAILVKTSESGEQELLRSLINGCKEFLENKNIQKLSEGLKRIFYHGLSLDSNVSNTWNWLHYQTWCEINCQSMNHNAFPQMTTSSKQSPLISLLLQILVWLIINLNVSSVIFRASQIFDEFLAFLTFSTRNLPRANEIVSIHGWLNLWIPENSQISCHFSSLTPSTLRIATNLRRLYATKLFKTPWWLASPLSKQISRI